MYSAFFLKWLKSWHLKNLTFKIEVSLQSNKFCGLFSIYELYLLLTIQFDCWHYKWNSHWKKNLFLQRPDSDYSEKYGFSKRQNMSLLSVSLVSSFCFEIDPQSSQPSLWQYWLSSFQGSSDQPNVLFGRTSTVRFGPWREGYKIYIFCQKSTKETVYFSKYRKIARVLTRLV